MAPQMVELTPFLTPCPVGETRFLDCADGATVGDIVLALSQCLGVQARTLSLLQRRPNGAYVVLHNKEQPAEQLFVRGAKSLEGVPSSMQISRPSGPAEMTKEIAQQIQEETMEVYSEELLTVQIKKLQQNCLEKWMAAGKMINSDWTVGLRALLQPRQATFFPKWGYEASTKGMVAMQQAFNTFQDDDDIQNNTNRINVMLGTDMTWVPAELTVEAPAEPVKETATQGFLPPEPAAQEQATGPPPINEADIQE